MSKMKKCFLWSLVGAFLFCIIAKPEFMSRNSIKKIDYKTMEHIFDQNPLPESMTISQVHYRGYSLIFNGPDGPRRSDYELLMDAQDYLLLREELLPFRKGDTSYVDWSITSEFGNDFMDCYFSDNIDFQDKEESWPPTYAISRPIEGREYKTYSALMFDDRSSPTIKAYVNTRAYLWIQ